MGHERFAVDFGLPSPTALVSLLAAVVSNVATQLSCLSQPSEFASLDFKNIVSSLSCSAFNADALPENRDLRRVAAAACRTEAF